MNLIEQIRNFHINKVIPDEFIVLIEEDQTLRIALVNYFKEHQDREFVIHLLDKMISFRIEESKGMTGDSIMLACYLLGLHQHIEDCLRVWNAKTTDFDTLCYIDIQLVLFAGLNETVAYLSELNTDDSNDALKYILECKACGDFELLESYYSKDTLPWYV